MSYHYFLTEIKNAVYEAFFSINSQQNLLIGMKSLLNSKIEKNRSEI